MSPRRRRALRRPAIACRPRAGRRRRRRRARAGSRRRASAALTVAERTWVPAMVPWRATEDGVVTPEVLDWYARFAEGQPGRAGGRGHRHPRRASGPLLRIGDDRFLPGLRRLVETVRERSGGRTRLFIQAHRLPRRAPPARAREVLRALSWRSTASLRERLARRGRRRGLARRARGRAPPAPASIAVDDRAFVEAVLTPRQLEALDFGYRERVVGRCTCRGSATCRARCPGSSPTPRAAPARPASTASSCTTPTPTRWRPSSRA